MSVIEHIDGLIESWKKTKARYTPEELNGILLELAGESKVLDDISKMIKIFDGDVYKNLYEINKLKMIGLTNNRSVVNEPRVNPHEMWLQYLINLRKAPDWYTAKIKRSKVYHEYNKFISEHDIPNGKIDTKSSKTKFIHYMDNRLIRRLDDKTQMDREMIFNMVSYEKIKIQL